MRFAVLLGLVILAVPVGLAALLLPRSEPQPHVWAKSPPEPPVAAPELPGPWDVPARDSLSLLRRTTLKEARRAVAKLAACEARAQHDASHNLRYRRCATEPLARAGAFAKANSGMLSRLIGSSQPTRACRGRVLALSGAANSLAFVTNSTLRGGLQAPWNELLDASRSIRGLASEAVRLARQPGWRATCKPRPSAAKPTGPVL